MCSCIRSKPEENKTEKKVTGAAKVEESPATDASAPAENVSNEATPATPVTLDMPAVPATPVTPAVQTLPATVMPVVPAAPAASGEMKNVEAAAKLEEVQKTQQEAMNKAMVEAQKAYMEEQRKQEERLKNDPQWQPSFEQSTVIKVNEGINSFCLNQEGNLLVCCHKNVAGGAIQELGNMIFKQADEKNVNEIRVCSPEGKKIGEWKMDTEPQAICLGGDGTIYVGGAGKLIKLDKDGKVLLTADAPNVADLPPPPSPPEEKAEPEDKNPVEAKKAKENRIAELQKKMQEYQTEFQEAANGLDPNDAAAVEAYQAKIQEPMEKFQAVMQELQELQMTPQMRYQQALMARDRQMMITGLAVADQDLFVVCMSSKGHGFVVWRTDLDFAQPKKIVEKLAGCCGQMDVQTKNGELWIAHNGKHKVEHYDRDGKMLSSFGKTDRIAPDGFGGCCEPKNLRFAPNDELLASESGPPTCVKRFSTDGTFLGTAVVAPWKSGCVRVTTEMSADGGKIFLLNTGENAIHVFTKKPAETASAEKSNSDEPKP